MAERLAVALCSGLARRWLGVAAMAGDSVVHRRLPTTVDDMFDENMTGGSLLDEGAVEGPGGGAADYTSSRFFDDPDSDPMPSDGDVAVTASSKSAPLAAPKVCK